MRYTTGNSKWIEGGYDQHDVHQEPSDQAKDPESVPKTFVSISPREMPVGSETKNHLDEADTDTDTDTPEGGRETNRCVFPER
jgi:hypothetical protein